MNVTEILQADQKGVVRAAKLLASGGLVAFPTETVYGLGADARNGQAVAAIYEAKGRPSFNPLIVHVATHALAQEIADIPQALLPLAETFWPGPLTLVVPVRSDAGISELATAGLPSVALRIPFDPVAHALLSEFGGPIAAPSANPSGRISPTQASHVVAGLDGKIAAVLDGGQCDVGLESTIVGLRGDAPVLMRAGGLDVAEIEAELGRPLAAPIADKIEAPGQLVSHYAPRAPIRLDVTDPAKDEAYLGFGGFGRVDDALNLSKRGDLKEAASNLFAHLHALDELVRLQGLTGIAVAPVPAVGLGLAINDRLRRAAA